MCGALLTLSHTQAYAKRVNLNNQNKRAGGEGKKWRAVRLGCVLVALEPSGEGGGGVVLGLKPRALPTRAQKEHRQQQAQKCVSVALGKAG